MIGKGFKVVGDKHHINAACTKLIDEQKCVRDVTESETKIIVNIVAPYVCVCFSAKSFVYKKLSTYTIYGVVHRAQTGPPCTADSTIAGYVRLGTCLFV